MGRTREWRKRGAGPPIFGFEAVAGAPLVSIQEFGRGPAVSMGLPGPHVHDYLALGYFERDGGSLCLGSRLWDLRSGDAFVVPPGEVIDPSGLAEAQGWAVFFPAEVIASSGSGTFFSWRSHPLLFPFVSDMDQTGSRARRLVVPEAERPSWSTRLSELALELEGRRDGYREAALAHLILLLVSISRITAEVVADLRLNDEPLLAEVFGCIEERYGDRVSLKDVAQAVSLSPGHLTTVVRRKTGRTVQEWISERRLAEARRLLVETDLAVGEIGHRVGYNDPGYFVKTFRRAHGATPLGWRRSGRP